MKSKLLNLRSRWLAGLFAALVLNICAYACTFSFHQGNGYQSQTNYEETFDLIPPLDWPVVSWGTETTGYSYNLTVMVDTDATAGLYVVGLNTGLGQILVNLF